MVHWVWLWYRSVRGVRRLRDFTLDAAECSTAADKTAILKTIGEWYADTQAGATPTGSSHSALRTHHCAWL